MRHKLLIAAIALLSIASNIQAQCPDKYMGTARMYPFEEIVQTAAPKGYKPAYISHYGRHGARYATHHAVYDLMMQALQAGHDAAALTEYGEEVYQRYVKVYPELQNHHGDLCRTGELQQRRLADRMVDTYPGVFKGKIQVDACSSIVPRAIVSMSTFCTELQKRCPKAEISERSYSSEQLRLNGVAKENPLMKNPTIGKAMKDIYGSGKSDPNPEKEKVSNMVLAPFFTDTSVLEPLGGSMKVFMAMIDAVKHMPESEDKMDDIFDEKIYEMAWEKSNASFGRMYTDKVEGMSLMGVLTYTLMDDFIDMKEVDMENGTSVRLRFGHDMVLFGLLALMEIDDWANEIDASNMPMASNLKMIVYTKKGAEDLVKFVYNDKECRLPIESDIAPYYKWSDVKAYCSNISSRVKGLLEK